MPIGVDDFKAVHERDLYYIDKSMLIKDILDDGAEVNLIARPRRFGKTLNLSMLRYFFEKTEESRRIFSGSGDMAARRAVPEGTGQVPGNCFNDEKLKDEHVAKQLFQALCTVGYRNRTAFVLV